MKREDLTGHHFGILTVKEAAASVNRETKWLCHCACGREVAVYTKALKREMTTSCGCTRERHGASSTTEYATWRRMHDRCKNPKNKDWLLYGGKGICIEFKTFSEFFSEIGIKPSPRHSVDRISSEGNYAPGNVRWATPKEQANNLRTNRLITALGKTLTLSQWADLTGISRQTIEKRLDVLGWSSDESMTKNAKSPATCK